MKATFKNHCHFVTCYGSFYLFGKLVSEYNMKISIVKTKVMIFREKDPVRSKIIMNVATTEQVFHFHYLVYDVTYSTVSYTHLDVYKRQR